MKLTTFLLLVSFFQIQANTYSQNTKISLRLNNATFTEVFAEIEALSDFRFLYNHDKVDLDRKISVNADKERIIDVLKSIFADSNIRFAVQKKLIILSTGKAIVSKSPEPDIVADLQDQTITGKVLDANGQPLAGANILEKGTVNGTQTDFDGNFSITIAGQDAILVFSYIGFSSKEISLDGQTDLNMVLEEDAQGLEEVVVVGYGTTKRKNITGAVATVNLEDSPIALSPKTNILQALRGGAGGINIGAQNSVGGTPNVLVRGQNSINGDNNPLIVYDGVIFLGTIADINPADIASIDVLKDASAAAAFGSRSANGVIVINTKKGKTEKPTIRYSSTTGINVWQNKPKLLQTDRYLEKYAIQNNFASVNDIVWDDEYRTVLFDQRVNTDWVDLISRSGVLQRHNLSVSGQASKVNYFFSGGYEKQNGVIVGDEFRRISLRTRLNVDVTDWLEVGIDGSYNNNDFSGQEANVGDALISAPIGYPYRYDGQPFNAGSNASTAIERYPTGSSVNSPLRGTDGSREDLDKRNFFRFTGNANIKVPWVKGLSYKLNYSVNSETRTQGFFENELYHVGEANEKPYFDRYSPGQLQTRLSQARGRNRERKEYSYVVDNILNYNKDFGKNSLDLTLVATRDFRSTKTTTLDGQDFSVNGNTTLGINGLPFAVVQTNTLDIVERSNVGYLARIGYAFDNKYHLNASVRRDGASVFGSERKYGTFSSVGLAWTITEEGFAKGGDVLNYLKVNASYGVNGNQGVNPYETLPLVDSGASGDIEYAFGDAPSDILFGIEQARLANPNLGWERTTSLNAGFQSVWFNNRVFLDADFYFSKTTDQLFTRQIPIQTGFESIRASLGQVDNRGMEINLRTINVANENFTWESNINFWRNRNEVVSLFGDDIDGDGQEEDDIANSLFIGESLGAIYGYEFVGIVQEGDTQYIENVGAQPGDPMFRDLDGDGFITAENDRKILGFDKENFRLSLSNTLTYKNFSLYALISGAFGGNGFYQASNPRYNSFRTRFDTNDVDNGQWWTPENRSTTNLRPGYIGNRYSGLQSRGFVRLQDVTLSYRLPQKTLNSINVGINSLEFFATANNALIITDWFGGGDPEFEDLNRDIRGIEPQENIKPVLSVYSLGVNVSF